MKKYRLPHILLCALISTSMHAEDAAKNTTSWNPPAQKEKFHIFILMGQSNMAGYGDMLPEDKLPVPHVVKLPTKGEMKWAPAAHPLHNRLPSDRFGLGLPFAIEYLKDKPGVTVGFIPVAWGGAGIDQLKKGTETYADAMKKAAFANTNGIIKGILWHQGESDTVNASLADSYESKLHQLITDVRKDLNDDNLPFIVGNLAEFYGSGPDHRAPERVKNINKVREILRALPGKIANTGFVESTDRSSPDQHMVHFDRKSYIILGKRYAEVYLKREKVRQTNHVDVVK